MKRSNGFFAPVLVALAGCAIQPTASSGVTDHQILCQSYCTEIANICTGANTQYANLMQCNDLCNAWTESNDLVGNNLECRLQYLQRAQSDPTTNCNIAGISGGGSCGNWYQDYCAMALTFCTRQRWNTPNQNLGNNVGPMYMNFSQCMQAAQGQPFPTTGMLGDLRGNTVQCRITYLIRAAAMSASAANENCPMADENPPTGCVGGR